MELLPTAISTGWASGVNAYATVAMLGILGRAGYGDVPDQLTSDPIIATALVMFAVEFITDKIPLLDSLWDVIHTAVRPAVGSAIGFALADGADVSGLDEVLTGGASGATALLSHGIKAGLRLVINTSPEPFTNIGVSLAEDGAVIGITAFALSHPWISLSIVTVLLAIGISLVIFLWKRIRKALEQRRERRRE